jgi:hypothetical protein
VPADEPPASRHRPESPIEANQEEENPRFRHREDEDREDVDEQVNVDEPVQEAAQETTDA